MKEWKNKGRKNKKNDRMDKRWKIHTRERGEGVRYMKGI
jgi:hypothetical protein